MSQMQQPPQGFPPPGAYPGYPPQQGAGFPQQNPGFPPQQQAAPPGPPPVGFPAPPGAPQGGPPPGFPGGPPIGAPPMGAPPPAGFPPQQAPPPGYPPQQAAPAQQFAPAGQPQQFAAPQAPGGALQRPAAAAAVATAPANVQFFGVSVQTYQSEAQSIKESSAGDFIDKLEGNADGSMSNHVIRIGPPLTADGRFARFVLKFFIPKNLADPSQGKDVFFWPEGADQALGKCPLIDCLERLKQMGMAEAVIGPLEPNEFFYVQGWMRDETFVNLKRTKPSWINLKKSIYNQVVQFIANQSQLYGDLFNPHSGWDIMVTRQGKGLGTKYQTSVVPCSWTGARGPIHPDQNVVEECLRGMKPLPEQFPIPNAQDIAQMQDAAKRIMDHFNRMGFHPGAMVPAFNPGHPNYPQMAQPGAAPPVYGAPPGYTTPPGYSVPQGMVPGAPQIGAPMGAPGMGAPPQSPGMPPGYAPPQQQFAPPAGAPGYPPQGGPPGYPPQAGPPGYPPQAGPGVPGMPPGFPAPGMAPPGFAPPGMPPGMAPGMQPGYPPQGQPPQFGAQPQRSFNDAPADAASQPGLQTTVGGAAAPVTGATPRRSLDEARALVQLWGLQPAWVASVSPEGYMATVMIPADAQGVEGAGATWYYSLVEECYSKGDKKGQPKAWRSESTRGLKRHVNTILKKNGEQPIGGVDAETETPAAPPQPVAEPVLPAPGVPSGIPPQVPQPGFPQMQEAMPQQQFQAPPQGMPPPAAYPQQQAAPIPAVANTQPAPGQNGYPQCFFNPQYPDQTGFYVISARNPTTCATCPVEDPCMAAANQAQAQAHAGGT